MLWRARGLKPWRCTIANGHLELRAAPPEQQPTAAKRFKKVDAATAKNSKMLRVAESTFWRRNACNDCRQSMPVHSMWMELSSQLSSKMS
jgi:hypothetical protein